MGTKGRHIIYRVEHTTNSFRKVNDVTNDVSYFVEQTEFMNSLKYGFLLSNISASSSYLTGNILYLHYKDQPVNAVWEEKKTFFFQRITQT
jgi:hypothetical protein